MAAKGEGRYHMRMTVATRYPPITKTAGVPARLTRVPRVRVAQVVMEWLAHGWTVDEMCRQHPYLLPAEAHAAMTYYYDHAQEIDAEIQAETAETSSAAGTRSPFNARMKAEGRL